jgi:hypothetical protein
MNTQKSGSATGSTGSVQTPPAVTEHLDSIRNPTDFLNVFRDIVGRAKQAGVTQQQLLDSISDNYGSSK